ncbi:MAG TPA: bifunctional tRNA (5-methylaminomethyl-2-thiouridine)(34)-methyltransferase MnmD/FAD-dependent 5-carboxymethylaminomethyl-2-thiouridine(34) oxidoreductase MnmC, partial [Pseudomonadales bacterium]|nr:bifunctional tRNA (5-methylaminomethyl-2-thiouridine)(34)-methyltransferase MnmD/FAD-dependent 5-carboxymethylaminomethyl-2-thiouridine(34) oxidoreductase MnmC [Pseudomonadales bacterium]
MKQVSPDQKIDAIQPARIEWRDGAPFSIEFNDVYFSRAGGLDETGYVFLQHNQLAERFQHGETPFVIAETGFGTGLNFLCAWQTFLHHAPPARRLHFISAEKHPLTQADLQQAHQAWPELGALSRELIARYPALTPGFHRLQLANGRIQLSLLFGDAAEQFAQLHAQVDAWFLDGFSPSQNPQLWQQEVLTQMQRLSKVNHTTFATFTAASWVRKALEQAGFSVQKAPGFGRKREMLFGRLTAAHPAQPLTSAEAIAKAEPWFEFQAPRTPAHAIVIGAGLAGAATAAALAERGMRVTVLEKNTPACGASGNAQGVIFTKLSPYNTPQTRFYQHSYLFACRRIQQILGSPDGLRWARCGMLQLSFDAAEQARQEEVQASGLWPASLAQPVDAATASSLAGMSLPSGGLFFPDSGWVNPPALIEAYLNHPNIQLHCQTEAIGLQRCENGWRIESATQS